MQTGRVLDCVPNIAVDEASEAFLESEWHSRKASTSRGTHGPRVHVELTSAWYTAPLLPNFNPIRLDDRHPYLRSYSIASHNAAQYSAPVRPEPPELAPGQPLDLDPVRFAITDSSPDMPPATCAHAAAQVCHCGRGHQQGRCAWPPHLSAEVFGRHS
jgi:hypothetical protein